MFSLADAFPITRLQVLLGTQVISEQGGGSQVDLRDSAGNYFSVPRTPGTYNIVVTATDTTGQMGCTTTARPVIVQ